MTTGQDRLEFRLRAVAETRGGRGGGRRVGGGSGLER